MLLLISLLCADLIFFPGGDSGLSACVMSASEESGEEEQQEEGKGKEREENRVSVEVQIGRKLREIGDHFQQEHMQLVRETHSLTNNPNIFSHLISMHPLK